LLVPPSLAPPSPVPLLLVPPSLAPPSPVPPVVVAEPPFEDVMPPFADAPPEPLLPELIPGSGSSSPHADKSKNPTGIVQASHEEAMDPPPRENSIPFGSRPRGGRSAHGGAAKNPSRVSTGIASRNAEFRVQIAARGVFGSGARRAFPGPGRARPSRSSRAPGSGGCSAQSFIESSRARGAFGSGVRRERPGAERVRLRRSSRARGRG